MQQLLKTKEPDAAIALGVVVRGRTRHFDSVSAECSRGLSQLALDTGIPIIFGVLSVEDRAQAEERVGPVLSEKDFPSFNFPEPLPGGEEDTFGFPAPPEGLAVNENMAVRDYILGCPARKQRVFPAEGYNRGEEYALAALRMATLRLLSHGGPHYG